ncbi:MAG: alpha-N-arabinofuranosidase, partial [Ruminococcus sp.]|nr:alpha-N-arabinofuranosidase [Ruminococcus sp.]
ENGTPGLRWPGGCFAEEYHWKDGVCKERKPILNTNWGCVVEDNSFGTNEFFDLCEELDCEPYLAGNLGSGTVRELAEWLEYITHDGNAPAALERKANGREKPWRLKYLGIGNENWGGGGNMRPEAYADEYRRYETFAKNFSTPDMIKVACGPNANDYHWTEVIMQNLKPWHTGAISLHYYTLPTGKWEKKGDAVTFDEEEYYRTISGALFMDELIEKHTAIMNRYDPEGKIKLIVDEWGCWYDVEEGTDPGFLYQQNTMRDAITAAINLNLFNLHSDRVMMANLAQVMNVLQAVLLSDGVHLVKTPTWQIFKLFLPHHGAELIRTSLAAPTLDKYGCSFPMLSYSLSRKGDTYFLTVSNCSLDEACTLLLDPEIGCITEASAQIVTAEIHAYNDFDGSTPVAIADYSDIEIQDGKLLVKLPARSVTAVTFR